MNQEKSKLDTVDGTTKGADSTHVAFNHVCIDCMLLRINLHGWQIQIAAAVLNGELLLQHPVMSRRAWIAYAMSRDIERWPRRGIVWQTIDNSRQLRVSYRRSSHSISHWRALTELWLQLLTFNHFHPYYFTHQFAGLDPCCIILLHLAWHLCHVLV